MERRPIGPNEAAREPNESAAVVEPVRNLAAMATRFDTHEVINQPPPLSGYDVFRADVALVEAVEREGAAWAGRRAATSSGCGPGRSTRRSSAGRPTRTRPFCVTHDRYGNRVDNVRYHPAYHELMTVAVGHGLHAAPWADDRAGAHVARAAKIIVWYQVDGGHICPISMTYSVVPALRHAPEIAQRLGAAAHQRASTTRRTGRPRSRPARPAAWR